MGLSLQTGFSFMYMIQLWAFSLYVQESIAHARISNSVEVVQLWGELGESWEKGGSTVRPA